MIAFDPSAKRHDVPGLLNSLFDHEDARTYVEKISRLAEAASKAISNLDIDGLGQQVLSYISLFDEWSNGQYTAYSCDKAKQLERVLDDQLVAWKPPGGGATKSIAAFLRDEKARDKALTFFKRQGWWATPLYVTGGISAEFIRSDGQVRFTAGHRLDLIGAADLGQDPKIGVSGECCSCAIEPRAELIIHGQEKTG